MRTENIFEEKIEVGHRKRKYLEKDFFLLFRQKCHGIYSIFGLSLAVFLKSIC